MGCGHILSMVLRIAMTIFLDSGRQKEAENDSRMAKYYVIKPKCKVIFRSLNYLKNTHRVSKRQTVLPFLKPQSSKAYDCFSTAFLHSRLKVDKKLRSHLLRSDFPQPRHSHYDLLSDADQGKLRPANEIQLEVKLSPGNNLVHSKLRNIGLGGPSLMNATIPRF